jgi:hypothetical protein
MKAFPQIVGLLAILLLARPGLAQSASADTPSGADAGSAKSWAFNLVVDGYIIPHEQGYADPDFTADRGWLHLEARYNNEAYRTASLWFGRNFTTGKKLVLNFTPIIGGVFGKTNGIAPGGEASLTYKKVAVSISNYYLFDTGDRAASYYYSWPQFTYTPVSWFRTGIVAQRNKLLHTRLDTQRGFFAGVSHKQFEFTTYVFNLGWTDPTVVLEIGTSF